MITYEIIFKKNSRHSYLPSMVKTMTVRVQTLTAEVQTLTAGIQTLTVGAQILTAGAQILTAGRAYGNQALPQFNSCMGLYVSRNIVISGNA